MIEVIETPEPKLPPAEEKKRVEAIQEQVKAASKLKAGDCYYEKGPIDLVAVDCDNGKATHWVVAISFVSGDQMGNPDVSPSEPTADEVSAYVRWAPENGIDPDYVSGVDVATRFLPASDANGNPGVNRLVYAEFPEER